MEATANVDVYLDDLISIIQGCPKERCQIIWHLFNKIDRVFRPNEATDTNRKEPISLNKIGQVDGSWYTQKILPGFNINNVLHLLRLPTNWQAKVKAELKAIPGISHTTSLRKWCKLLGMLQSITPDVAVSRGIFTRVQRALKRAAGMHFQLTTYVHDELDSWHNLISSLARRPTHLRELHTFPPTWMGTTDTSVSGMGGFYRDM